MSLGLECYTEPYPLLSANLSLYSITILFNNALRYILSIDGEVTPEPKPDLHFMLAYIEY